MTQDARRVPRRRAANLLASCRRRASETKGRLFGPPGAHRERGAAAVEMAIVLPLLLLVIAALIDFGRMFNAQILLSSASREGARMVAMGYTTGEADTRIAQALNGSGLAPTKTYVTCPSPPAASQAGSVTLTLPTSGASAFKWVILGQVSQLFGSAIPVPTIQAAGSMRCTG